MHYTTEGVKQAICKLRPACNWEKKQQRINKKTYKYDKEDCDGGECWCLARASRGRVPAGQLVTAVLCDLTCITAYH